MESVLRAACVYIALLVIVRVSGRRTLGQLTTFDFILLLIIGEAIQQALLGDDFSLMNGLLVIVTLISIDVGLSFVKRRSPNVEKWLEGTPTVIVNKGRPLKKVLEKARVSEEDILHAARKLHGLERMEQIKYAVLEPAGEISVIPWEQPRAGERAA